MLAGRGPEGDHREGARDGGELHSVLRHDYRQLGPRQGIRRTARRDQPARSRPAVGASHLADMTASRRRRGPNGGATARRRIGMQSTDTGGRTGQSVRKPDISAEVGRAETGRVQ